MADDGRPRKFSKEEVVDLAVAYRTAVRSIACIVAPERETYTESEISEIVQDVNEVYRALTHEFQDKDWTKAYMFVEFACGRFVRAMSNYETHARWPNVAFYARLVPGVLVLLMGLDERQTMYSNNGSCCVSVVHVAELWWKGLIHYRARHEAQVNELHRLLRARVSEYIVNVGHQSYLYEDNPLRLVHAVMDAPLTTLRR